MRQLKTETVLRWFHSLNVLASQVPADVLARYMEAFWPSQLRSKLWLADQLSQHYLLGHLTNAPVYIYGGWYGVLGQILFDETRASITSVDIDPQCALSGPHFAPDVRFHTDNMVTHRPSSPHAVSINTSSEHITQEEYDQWYANRPKGSLVVVQGNNLFGIPEHIRCHATLDEFIAASRLTQIVYRGSLDLDQFTRFMVIGFT